MDNKMVELANKTRSIGKESKRLMQKCLGLAVPNMGDLDDEMSLMLRDSIKLLDSAYDLIDLMADIYEEQGRQANETQRKLDDILKEVKEKKAK